MSFFDSEVVRAEMTEVGQLQQEVYTSMFSFYSMTKEDKIKHIDLLSRLLEKQKVLYTRLSLSDDPEAQKLKQRIIDSASMMGLDSGKNIVVILEQMSKSIETMRKALDESQKKNYSVEVHPQAKYVQIQLILCLSQILKSNPLLVP